MSAGTMTTRRAALRWGIMAVVLISPAAGLGPVAPAPQAAADVASLAASPGTRAGPASTFTAYVANAGSGTVTPIATAASTAEPPIPTGEEPDVIAITPDGKTAYVANAGSGTVTPIATATNTAGAPIPTGQEPDAIAITPDGKTAYVANTDSDTVTPIATATNTAGAPIPTGNFPDAIAITPAASFHLAAGRLDGRFPRTGGVCAGPSGRPGPSACIASAPRRLLRRGGPATPDAARGGARPPAWRGLRGQADSQPHGDSRFQVCAPLNLCGAEQVST